MTIRYSPKPRLGSKWSPRWAPRFVADSMMGESGQVANWLFYNGAGDILHDFGGKGYHGTLNGPKWSDERSASWTLKFGSGDYVKIGDSEIVSHDPEQTVTAWLYLETLPSNEITLYGEGDDTGPLQYLEVLSDGTVRWGIYTGGTWYFSESTATLNTGEWYYLAGTLDSVDGMKTWINGSQDGSNSNTNPCDEAIAEVRIGQNWYVPETIDGMIGLVRLYSLPLNGELKTHHEATKPLYV